MDDEAEEKDGESCENWAMAEGESSGLIPAAARLELGRVSERVG